MQNRGDTPSPSKIAEWWGGRAGRSFIQELGERHGADLALKLEEIDQGAAHCWACGYAPRRGKAKYTCRYLALDRCHVKPLALGGTNDPSNLLMMCKECHGASPDSISDSIFWRWFARVEDRSNALIQGIAEIIPQDLSPIEEAWFLEAFKDRLRQERPVLVRGVLPDSLVLLLVEDVTERWLKGVGR